LLSLSLSLSDSEELEDEADRLELSVSQFSLGVWYWDGWLGAAEVEEGREGARGLDDGLDDVVEGCPDGLGVESLCTAFADSRRAVGLVSGVWIVI